MQEFRKQIELSIGEQLKTSFLLKSTAKLMSRIDCWLGFIAMEIVMSGIVALTFSHGLVLSGLLIAAIFSVLTIVFGISCATRADLSSGPSVLDVIRSLDQQFLPLAWIITRSVLVAYFFIAFFPKLASAILPIVFIGSIDPSIEVSLLAYYLNASTLMIYFMVWILGGRKLFADLYLILDTRSTARRELDVDRDGSCGFLKRAHRKICLVVATGLFIAVPITLTAPFLIKMAIVAMMYLVFRCLYEAISKIEAHDAAEGTANPWSRQYPEEDAS